MSLRILAAGAALAAATGLTAAAQTTTSPANTASSGGAGDSTVTTHQQQDPTIGSGQLAGQGASKTTHLKSHHVKRMPRSHASGAAMPGDAMAPGGPGAPPPTLPTQPDGAGSSTPGSSGPG